MYTYLNAIMLYIYIAKLKVPVKVIQLARRRLAMKWLKLGNSNCYMYL